MSAQRKLKLVHSKKPEPQTRPFQTYYFPTVGRRYDSTMWSRRGRAKTLRGAIRAAFLHIIDREVNMAVVYDEQGKIVGSVIRKGRSRIITIGM